MAAGSWGRSGGPQWSRPARRTARTSGPWAHYQERKKWLTARRRDMLSTPPNFALEASSKMRRIEFALLLGSTLAHAADQTILGSKLRVKNPSTAEKRQVSGSAKEKASPD